MTNRLQFINSKILTLENLSRSVELWKMKGDKIVFTNGCFDLLHRGHLSYLAEAASFGNRLIVAVNTDNSVKKQNKGSDRPINNEDDRLFALASLGFVDALILFDDETPLKIIETIVPDVLVKGGDYDAEEKDQNSKKYIVGSDIVTKNKGTVKTIDLVDGYSTTNLISKIKS